VAAAAALAGGALAYQSRLREANAGLSAALDDARRAQAEAAREHDRAEANLHRALDAADRMVTQVGERLAGRPGVGDVRQQLLEEALEFHRGFLRAESNDPAVRRETGRAAYRTAVLYLILGRSGEAESACREALRLQEALVADFPDRDEYRHDLARTRGYLGHVYVATGRYAEALAAYDDALTVAGRLAEAHPEDGKVQETLLSLLNGRGFFRSYSDPAKAEVDFRRAVDAAQRLASSPAGGADADCFLAAAYTNLGMILLRTGRVAEAGALLEKGHALLEPAGRAARGATEYRATEAANLVVRGGWYSRTGDRERAERCLRDGVTRYEALVADNPKHFIHRTSLWANYPALAEACLQSGRTGEADVYWRKAIELADEMTRDYPTFQWIAGGADRVRVRRLAMLAQKGKAAGLLSEAEAVAAKQDLSGDTCYNLACVYALAAAEATDPAEADRYGRRAVALLSRPESVKYLGIPAALAHARKDEDLRALQVRKDFQDLLDRSGAGAAGKPLGP
jgi:tetratricopeptide (TPR) repeat protein